jgi:hypothetical protein
VDEELGAGAQVAAVYLGDLGAPQSSLGGEPQHQGGARIRISQSAPVDFLGGGPGVGDGHPYLRDFSGRVGVDVALLGGPGEEAADAGAV